MPDRGRALEYLMYLQELSLEESPIHRAMMEQPAVYEAEARAHYQRLLDDVLSNGDPVPAELKEANRASAQTESHFAYLDAIKTQLQTPYEDGAFQWIVHRYGDELLTAAEALGFPTTNLPVIGTLPTGRVNAIAIRVPESGERIVALNQGMFSFLHSMSKVVAQALPLDAGTGTLDLSPEALSTRIKKDVQLQHRFSSALQGYILVGDVRASEPYLLPPIETKVAQQLLQGAEQFVLGHELGHLFHGHLGEAVPRRMLKGITVQEFRRSWEEEFEADYLGLRLLLEASKRRDQQFGVSGLSLWGAALFFGSADALEKALTVAVTGQEQIAPSDSHPATIGRQKALREAGFLLLGATAGQALALANAVAATFDSLWSVVRDIFHGMYTAGVVPAVQWTANPSITSSQEDAITQAYLSRDELVSALILLKLLRERDTYTRRKVGRQVAANPIQMVMVFAMHLFSDDPDIREAAYTAITIIDPTFEAEIPKLRYQLSYLSQCYSLQELPSEVYESLYRLSAALEKHALTAQQ